MLELLKERFMKNPSLHPELVWEEVEESLRKNPDSLTILKKMEETGGEVNTIGRDEKTGRIIYCDCCIESPKGRRSLCYDDIALKSRKNNPPTGSVLSLVKEMNANLMDEEIYMQLQKRGEFDLKTSSWIMTPEEIRNQGGALFCERRYTRVFTFHNGADSYYSVRGFRCYILL